MTKRENNYSVGLPLSVILCMICAAGGCSIFASLYSGLALFMVGYDDFEILVVKDYIFVFVFCTVYSAAFGAQMKIWNGGKLWNSVHILFLFFYLTCYMYRFWPQLPQMNPDFTVRAFLWYGATLAVSLVAFDYRIKNFGKSSEVYCFRKLVLYRNLSLTFGSLVVIVPLALTSLTGIAFNLPLTFTVAPMSLLILSSAIYVYKECKNLGIVETMARLLTIWYPVGWCFLLMPLILVLDKVLSRYFLDVFVINAVHLYAAILAFIVLVFALISGFVIGIIDPRVRS